jgi:hypothetical protein
VFSSHDRVTLTRAFITYVRPLHAYASCCWSPYHIADTRLVEPVLVCTCVYSSHKYHSKVQIPKYSIRRVLEYKYLGASEYFSMYLSTIVLEYTSTLGNISIIDQLQAVMVETCF